MTRLTEYLKPGRHAWSDAFNNSPHQYEEGCCIACGKLTKGNGINVALTDGGDVLVLPEDIDAEERGNAGAYMGVWTVGPECGKNIPHQYRLSS